MNKQSTLLDRELIRFLQTFTESLLYDYISQLLTYIQRYSIEDQWYVLL
jgi:hypothetical protein